VSGFRKDLLSMLHFSIFVSVSQYRSGTTFHVLYDLGESFLGKIFSMNTVRL
jgi:hypothetical protein